MTEAHIGFTKESVNSQFILLAVFALTLTSFAAPRPNILVVFTDDQRSDAVGYAGNDIIQTPTLDRLATRGVVFRNCFVNTSICAVSRANLLTGQYPRRHGINDFFKTFGRRQLDQTYPALLRRAGYTTGFVGKWGIGDSVKSTLEALPIFDFWAGASRQTCFWHDRNCPYVVNNGRDTVCTCGPDSRGRRGPGNRIGKGGIDNPLHLTTDIFPAKVETFLRTRDRTKPFCLSLFFKAPHSPFTDWDDRRFAQRHVNAKMPVPLTATPEYERAKPAFLRDNKTMLGAASGRNWVENKDALHKHLRGYYRLIEGIDFAMERILAHLAAHGLTDNTVILFTSDNGHFKGEHGMAGKWLMREPSIRVPGFVNDPRLPPGRRGRRLSEPVTTIDFTATILELAGVALPGDMQGRSFLPLVEGRKPAEPWRTEWFYEHPYTHHGQIPFTIGVRTDRHKYTRYVSREPPFEEFFDLRNDPYEITNLVGTASQHALINSLRQKTDHYAQTLK